MTGHTRTLLLDFMHAAYDRNEAHATPAQACALASRMGSRHSSQRLEEARRGISNQATQLQPRRKVACPRRKRPTMSSRQRKTRLGVENWDKMHGKRGQIKARLLRFNESKTSRANHQTIGEDSTTRRQGKSMQYTRKMKQRRK